MARAAERLPDHTRNQQTRFDPYKQQLEKVLHDVSSREPRPQLIVVSGLQWIGKASFAAELALRLQAQDCGNTASANTANAPEGADNVQELALRLQDCDLATDLQDIGRGCPSQSVRTIIEIEILPGASHQDVIEDIAKKLLNYHTMHNTSSSVLQENLIHKLENLECEVIMLLFGFANAAVDEQPKVLDLVKTLVLSPTITIILTSRKELALPRLGPKFYPCFLHPPTEDESREYLESFAPHLPIMSYLESYRPVLPFRIGDILKRCGQHPKLVIRVANMLRDDVPISKIWEMVKDDPFSIFPEEGRATGGFGESALQSIKYEADRESLMALAQLDGSFNMDAMLAITGKDKSRQSVAVRSARSLLSSHLLATTNTGSGRYFYINELVKYTLNKNWPHLDGMVQSRNRFCLFYAKVFQQMTPALHSYQPANLPLFQADFANLQKLLQKATFATSEDFMYETILDIAHNSQEIIYDFFQKKEVLPFYESCVRAARHRNDRPRLAYVLIAMSHAVLMLHNNFEEVEGYLSEAQEILEEIGEMETLDAVRLHLERGWYYYKATKHMDAMSSYEEARRILLRIITGETEQEGFPNSQYLLDKAKSMEKGGLHLWVLSSVNTNIATIYTCIGNFESSISNFQQNLQLQNAVWTECHPHTALTNHKLGLTYLLNKDFANASRYGSKALSIRMFLVKGASHTTIQSLSMVAMAILEQTGDWERSLTLLREAIAMREELGPMHPDMGLLYHSMGNVYRFRGDHQSAKEQYQRAFDIRQAVYPALGSNFCTVESMDALADMHFEIGETEACLDVQTKCLTMCVKHLKEEATEGRQVDEHGIEVVKTACKKISAVYERKKEVGQAEIWLKAAESENPLLLIPRVFFPT